MEHSRAAVLAAFLANLGIAVAKLVGFVITGAASMLAEAIHSVADSGNQSLLFLGDVRSRRDPTPTHPFGYGRERYFWAFVVALVLFSVGSLFAVLEGIDKLRHPHALENPAVAVVILTVAIALEGWSFRTAVREARKVKVSTSWWRFIRRTKHPELPIVILEDTGALIGLVIALVGVVMASTTHQPRWDAAGSLSIGVLLGVIAILMMTEMKSHLIGEGAADRDQQLIADTICASPHVLRLLDLKTLHLGPAEILVGAKVELDPSLSFDGVAQAIADVEDAVTARLSVEAVIYIEPERADATPT